VLTYAFSGVDFDDADYGFKEEDKSEVKVCATLPFHTYILTQWQRRNEIILSSLADKCNGTFGTAAFAISCLAIPNVKTTRPYAPYKGRLSLGNFEKYPETSFYIDVERYSKTKVAKPVSASSYVSQNGKSGETQDSSGTIQGDSGMPDESGAGLAPVHNAKKYTIPDPEDPRGFKDVEFEELARGYEYGRTAVHITESEANITAFPTFKSFEIIGFIPNDKVGPPLSFLTCLS
jgi:ATP-dependent DNA helicase 2 subunit 2